MADTLDSIVEERVELMVSSDDKTLERRTAHFIKPSIARNSIDETVVPIPNLPKHCLSSLPTTFEPKKWPLAVNFVAWRYPQKDWKTWVDKMATLHEPAWKKAGIFEAIMNSTYTIRKNNDLVFGVAEKWCDETKSFIFPWGEATISLEDMKILGGYSVLGSPVFTPIETKEMEETLEKLNNARKEVIKSASNKASQGLWMKKFMHSGSEIEHEAFLALWLSRFVLPSGFQIVVHSVFPIAIHLARGTRIALGPAVLARVYRDLRFLKQNIVASARLDSNCDDEIIGMALWSPLTLVQVWVWERFSDLRPTPNLIKNCEPRLALWHDLKCKVQHVRSVLDSAKKRFKWRPYVNGVKFNGDTAMWVRVDTSLDDELLSFARCMRASELVGLDCIEQYLPHRVAMQFGMDQDVPGSVPRSNNSPEIAWSDYNNSVDGEKLYIPFRLFEADVTAGYSTWWKQSMLILQDENKNVFKSFKISPKSSKRSKEDDTCSGFKIVPKNLKQSHCTLKCKEKRKNVFSDHSSRRKRLSLSAQYPKPKKGVCNASFATRSSWMPREFPQKSLKCPAFGSEVKIESMNDTSSFSSLSKPLKELPLDFVIQKELNNSPFPPGFSPKENMLQVKTSFNRDKVKVVTPVPPGFTPKSTCINEDKVTVKIGRSARNDDCMEKETGENHEQSASHPGSVLLDSDDEDQLTIAEVLLKSNNMLENSGQCHSVSCLVADNEVPRGELITKLGAEQAANGASMVAAIDSNGERRTVEELANNLEARISRLERLVSEMKAA